MNDLQGSYTREVLQMGSPIRKSQLGPMSDRSFINDMFAVGIPVTGAVTLGGNLRAGDVVSVTAVPQTGQWITSTATLGNRTPTVIFDAVLILDVRTEENNPLLILALPAEKERWLDFLKAAQNSTLLMTRRVGDH